MILKAFFSFLRKKNGDGLGIRTINTFCGLILYPFRTPKCIYTAKQNTKLNDFLKGYKKNIAEAGAKGERIESKGKSRCR